MPSGIINSVISLAGLEFVSNIVRTDSNQHSTLVSVPAGKPGKISASGVDNLPTGHGIQTTPFIDVHWVDPVTGVPKCRYGITVDTTSANAITFNETPPAAGDTLPSIGTDCVVGVQVTGVIFYEGGSCSMLFLAATQNAKVQFYNTSPALDSEFTLRANQAISWADAQGVICPVDGAPVPVMTFVVSNGGTAAMNFMFGFLYDYRLT